MLNLLIFPKIMNFEVKQISTLHEVIRIVAGTQKAGLVVFI